jgi:putative flippase GtrA
MNTQTGKPGLVEPGTAPVPALKRIAEIYLTGQFARFLLAGGLAAAANFASRFAFEPAFGFWGAVTMAYGVGFLTAFALNKRYVFPASGRSLHNEIAWFFLFNLLALPIVLFASVTLNNYVFGKLMPEGLSRAASHGIAIMLPVVVNYVAHKFVTFRRTDVGN